MITVLGEFNRGKSTMVNALLGQDIIPTAIRPTTAALHFIRYGQKPAIQVHKADHSVLELPWDRNALKEYTALKDFAPESVNYIELSYPLEYLKDGTVLRMHEYQSFSWFFLSFTLRRQRTIRITAARIRA